MSTLRCSKSRSPRASSSPPWPPSATCRRTSVRPSRSQCSKHSRPRSPPSHPASQGDARSAAARPRHGARPGAGERDPGLGAARGRQGADRCHLVAGHRRRGRAQRRTRGSPRRPAHHARRAQRPAGSRQRPRGAGHRATRPRRGLVYRASGDGALLRKSSGSRSRSTIPWFTPAGA
jgi:hypothetical protein